MAGSIQITNNTALATNSLIFDAIVELSRKFFTQEEKELVKEVYAPLDQACFDIVSVVDVNVESFNAFYRGSKRAFEYCKVKGKCKKLDDKHFEFVMKSWAELLAMLEADVRFEPL